MRPMHSIPPNAPVSRNLPDSRPIAHKQKAPFSIRRGALQAVKKTHGELERAEALSIFNRTRRRVLICSLYSEQ